KTAFTDNITVLFSNKRVNLYPITMNSSRRCLVAILLLMGGIEGNPGPQPRRINMGLINTFSIVKKAVLRHDVITDYSLSLLAVTETFVYEDSSDMYKK